MMNLEFKRFQAEYYSEYESWFADPELNRQLGPMGKDWLDAVLAQPESEGVTWAFFRGSEMVAVIETALDPRGELPAGVPAIATKPGLRRQGIASAALQHILAMHESRGILEHVAYVSVDNSAGRRCVEKAGFVPAASQPDEQGFLPFRRRQEAEIP